MIGQPTPRRAVHDLRDCVAGNVEATANIDMPHARPRERTNLTHLRRVEFLLAEGVSSVLENAVVNVVVGGTEKQMGRIAAQTVITRRAVVADLQAVRDRPMRQLPRHHRRVPTNVLRPIPSHMDEPASPTVRPAVPQPARGRSAPVDFSPEAIREILRRMAIIGRPTGEVMPTGCWRVAY